MPGPEPPELPADAIEELFEATYRDVWRFVRRRVTSGVDADDATAEVYAVAWRRHATLPAPDERRLWLFGVARNVIANQRRSAIRRTRVTQRLASMAEPRTPVEPAETPDDTLWRALALLSDADRDLLIMRSWDQLVVGEMAVLLECTPNAVSVRLSKARNRLRDRLVEIESSTGAPCTTTKDRRPIGHGSSDPTQERSHQ